MNRRSLLAAAGTTLAAGVAGCASFETEPPESTTTPAPSPEPSTLRLRVENDADRSHDVTFRLTVQQDAATTVEAFEFRDLATGETRTRPPQELPAGEYELDVTLQNPLNMSTTIEWAGRDCPVKDVNVQLRDDGFRLRDACPEQNSQ